MSDHDPLYDMDTRGPADPQLERIEQTLASLRWQARELPLASIDVEPRGVESVPLAIASPIPIPRPRARGESEPPRWRTWSPFLAGLASAAALLGLAYATQPEPREPSRVPAPTIQPAGSPSASESRRSPDLLDPFATSRDPAAPPASADLRDPFGPRRHAKTPTAPTHSDLRNPFVPSVDDTDATWPTPHAKPSSRSPDLVDPFMRSPTNSTTTNSTAAQDDLIDPFGGSTTAPDKPASRSADLVDPFARPR